MRDNSPVLLKFELMNAADDSNYYVHSRVEIASILRTIMQKNTLLSIYFDEGNAFIVTVILDIDDAQGLITLDRGPDPRINARVPRASRLVCVTSVDRVKVQFICGDATVCAHDGREAFRVPMPGKLLRLQRREYFRLTTPVVNPVKCVLTAQNSDETSGIEVNVADISCGGLATNSSAALPLQEPSTRFACRIFLSENDTLHATVELRNTFEVTLANGRKVRRCGYQFIDLPEKGRVLVQRYIMQQQRGPRRRTGSFG